jgi:pyruvate dehydrogenase E2 component (dihydrolipoamide acetyltransferase)
VREADRKSILEISRDAQDKVQRTIDGKTAPDELSGGTFTITNLGALGVEAFTPIINPPEVGILGIGQIAQEPMAYRGEICLRYRMVLSLTFDHSLVDGAPAARFLGRVKDLIEKPYLMMVDDVS